MKEQALRQIIREEIMSENRGEWDKIPDEDKDLFLKANVGPSRFKRVERKSQESYNAYIDFGKLGLDIRGLKILERIGLQFIAIEDASTLRMEIRG